MLELRDGDCKGKNCSHGGGCGPGTVRVAAIFWDGSHGGSGAIYFVLYAAQSDPGIFFVGKKYVELYTGSLRGCEMLKKV